MQGITVNVVKTGEVRADNDGERWEKCIFTLDLVGFSKYASSSMPSSIKGKVVKLVRWCCFDWHYKIGVRKTLTDEETKAVLDGVPTSTVYW